jgi:ribonucleoside-diphosphate reductase beta chain
MRYPQFFEMYRDAIRNTWTVEEVDFSRDIPQLRAMSEAERHMINRLIAFFASGDSVVGNNLVLALYQNINAPEARMYLSRQLYEEALHVQFYLTLLDTYVPDIAERHAAFAAVDNIPSIARKAQWMQRHTALGEHVPTAEAKLLNIIAFAACVEGLFFYGAFTYIFFLKQKGLLPGLADGTNWVMRDETMHMNFAFAVVDVVRKEQPQLFTEDLERQVAAMLREAVELEYDFAKDALQGGVAGLSAEDIKLYLQCAANGHMVRLGFSAVYPDVTRHNLEFMAHQGLQTLSNFFERRVSDYAVNVQGEVRFDEEF